jgi:threonine aldolase
MIYFNNDYSEGCHPLVLEALTRTNLEQTPGYGTDHYCHEAADVIRRICGNEKLSVHFLVGGTQANMTVIDALLRPYQAVISADSGHINVHETGAVESTGHKVLPLSGPDGKITAEQVDDLCCSYFEQDGPEHMVCPGMVYISNPTEWGTLYTRNELEQLSAVCRKWNQLLFLDGARLGYGLCVQDNDLTWEDLARLCDVFYIGGTKVGALFGEAVVFSNAVAAKDFRFMIKQHGAMLAKGRLLGIQFKTLLQDDLYLRLGAYAVELADKLRATLLELGIPQLVDSPSNQIFPIFHDSALAELQQNYCFAYMQRVDASHSAVRICTSWATRPEAVEQLSQDLRRVVQKHK